MRAWPHAGTWGRAAGGERDEQGVLDLSNQDSFHSLNLATCHHTGFSRRNRLTRHKTPQSHAYCRTWERSCHCLNSPLCPRDCISQWWWNAAQVILGCPPPLPPCSLSSFEWGCFLSRSSDTSSTSWRVQWVETSLPGHRGPHSRRAMTATGYLRASVSKPHRSLLAFFTEEKWMFG